MLAIAVHCLLGIQLRPHVVVAVQCPWVGNAVGVRNYRDFVGFVFSATALSGFVGSSCVRGLIDHYIEDNAVVLQSGGSPEVGPAMCIVLILYCALVFFTTLGLLTYHLCLIAKNQTTNEDLKKVYQNVRAFAISVYASFVAVLFD